MATRGSARVAVASVAAALLAAALAGAPSGARAAALLDERGWELVSPIDKNGGAIQGPGQNHGGDVLQAAAEGGAVTYSSSASFGEAPQGAPPASQYISRRTAGGWSTENITTPVLSGSYGSEPNGVPYRLFSADLARGLLLNGVHCRGEGGDCPVANPPLPGSGAPPGYQDYYLRDDEAGSFTALLSEANDGLLSLPPEQLDLAFAGSSPDLAHVILSTCAKLSAEATEVAGAEGCEATKTNLYEWAEGQLHLVNLLPGQASGTPGAELAAQGSAVSEDGSRVYFTQGGNLHLRENATQPQSALGGGGACSEAAKACTVEVEAGGEFQTATPTGSFAFFTKAGHLYRYDAVSHSATDLTPSGGVLGVLGVSGEGSHVYYATAAGLYLWHGGATTPVIAMPGAAQASDYPPTTGTARVSADGAHLAFLSSASLTGYDNTDQRSGEPDSELYLYDATANAGAGALSCVSCSPTGTRPLGPSTIPGAVANGEGPAATDSYKPRVLAAGARRLFFDSASPLVPVDTNNRPDVYEWEAQGEGSCQKSAGCLALISSGRGAEGSSFVDASAEGSDAFFLTGASLVPSDPGSVDLYDARVGGGFPEAPPPLECLGDACQPLPEPPEDPTVGTLIPGPANPPLRFPEVRRRCPKGKRHLTRHGRTRCVARRPHHRGAK